MSVDEGLALDRFQQLTRLKGFWKYDVRLDVPVKPKGQFQSLEGHNAWVALKQKRIDALLLGESNTHIFEVKKTLNFAQFGQLIVYAHLYREQVSPVGEIILHAIAAKTDPDIERIMKLYNIKVHIV